MPRPEPGDGLMSLREIWQTLPPALKWIIGASALTLIATVCLVIVPGLIPVVGLTALLGATGFFIAWFVFRALEKPTRQAYGLYSIISLYFFVLVFAVQAVNMPADTALKEVSTPPEAETKDTYEIETTTESVSFSQDTTEDSNLWEGEQKIIQVGQEGIDEVEWKVFEYGQDEEVRRTQSKEPISEITAIGTKQKPITGMSWDDLELLHYRKAPLEEKVAIADRYLNENGLKVSGVPWQKPTWLVGELDRRIEEGRDDDAELTSEFRIVIRDWQLNNRDTIISGLAFGTSLDTVKAMLGEPSDSQHMDMAGYGTQDFLYYGQIDHQLGFENGRLTSKNQY